MLINFMYILANQAIREIGEEAAENFSAEILAL